MDGEREMSELVILGELYDTPMHGYLLQQILTQVLGPMRTVSWGMLYPVLQRLHPEGVTALSKANRKATGRPKKVYAITEQGRIQFRRLMARPLDHNAESEDIFRIKLAKFHLVDPPSCGDFVTV